MWRGEGPSHEQGIRVLGIPIGHVEFVQAQFRQKKTEMHRVLHERLSVQDLQSAWLPSSSTPMPKPRVRCVESRLLKLLILQRLMMKHLAMFSEVVESPFGPSEEGLRQPPVPDKKGDLLSAMRSRLVARRSAIVGMVPQVGRFFSQLNPKVRQLVSLGCWLFLTKVGSVMHPRSGSSSSWTLCCLGSLMTSARCSAPKQAPLRYSLSPQCRSPLNSGSISDIFRVLLRRVSLPLLQAVLYCHGHHRASCALAGVLGRRGCTLESGTARVCREARDLDLVWICFQDQ